MTIRRNIGSAMILRSVITMLLLLTCQLYARSQSVSPSPSPSDLINNGTLKIPRTFADEITLPSPEASKLCTYTDHPVLLNTGTLFVNIPLYTINIGRLSIPLSLSYHASGIKVADENCTTGLGWSLMGGGCVSRSVVGLPDEQVDFSLATSSSDLTPNFLSQALHHTMDTNYDRYSYCFNGYSGSFIIKNGRAVQLPPTDLTIQIENDKDVAKGVLRFVITTPSGDRYFFEEREHTEYHYEPQSYTMASASYRHDYTAVTSWWLSKIITATATDTIRFEYEIKSLSRYDFEKPTDSRSFTNSFAEKRIYENTIHANEGQNPLHRSTYSDKCYLKAIRSRTCNVDFLYSKFSLTKYNTLQSIEVSTPNGNIVRHIAFTYKSTYESLSPRTLLADITVKDGGVLTDHQTFEYYDAPSSTHTDLFGYKNYDPSHKNINTYSVLDTSGKLSRARLPRFESMRGYTLRSITDALGATTDFEYEPNTCDSVLIVDVDTIQILKPITGGTLTGSTGTIAPIEGGGSSSNATYICRRDSVYCDVAIGLRIKSVRVSDPQTGRWRLRTFTYEHPVCTHDFSRLSASDFISLGGNITYDTAGTQLVSYSTGATFSTSCRVPGYPLENATVYYGKVTEETSGIAISTPLRTTYEYDTSSVQCPYTANGRGGRSILSNNYRYLGSDIATNASTVEEAAIANLVFSPKVIMGHYRETSWEKAPLVCQTTYRVVNGTYTPAERIINRYTLRKAAVMTIGLHVESLTRNVQSDILREVLSEPSDFNYIPLTLQSGDLVKDSTILTTYNTDGTSRTITTAYRYDAYNTSEHPYGFEKADTLRPSSLHEVQSLKVSCGKSSIERDFCYADNVQTTFYRNIADNLGMRSLPLYEQVIANGTDTILVVNHYAAFGRTNNIQLSNQRILHKGAEMASQAFLGYDTWGNPLATSINHASPTSYLWGYNASLPIAVIKGAAITKDVDLKKLVNVDSLLVTRYAYEPLVGCTSITNPNGRTTNYAYKGGRLATIMNYCGNKISSYEYSINAEKNGTNMTSERVYTSASGATSRQTTVYYDAFGHPVTTINKNSSTEGRDLVMLTEYDALNRPTKEWQPVPMSNVSSLVNAADFSAASLSEYADNRAYIEKVYEQSFSTNAIKETQSGEAYSSHPTLTIISGNKSSNAMLMCYRFEANGSYAFRKKGTYTDGELSVVKTTDADGRTTLTFSDWRGNKILERSVIDKNKGVMADTYYVYDALGNLCFVLPPALKSMRVTAGMTWNIHECVLLRQYAYFYRYDNRGLLVEKKLPGAEPTLYINDLTGVAVFSQDGNLRKTHRWHFAFNDRFGRPTIEGTCAEPNASLVKKTYVHTSNPNYTNTASSISETGYNVNVELQELSVLSVNYYDDYAFLATNNFKGLSRKGNVSARGLKTGMRNYIMMPDSIASSSSTSSTKTLNDILSVFSYDNEDRIICAETSNLLGGIDRTETTYTFTSKPSTLLLTHTATTATTTNVLTTTERYDYTYDVVERPLRTRYSINGGSSVTLSDCSYDELGRLTTDYRNGNPKLITTYAYNLHGLPTAISTLLFSEALYYEQRHNGSAPQYGGNISAMDWQVVDSDNAESANAEIARTNSAKPTLRGYAFSYDTLSRLTAAKYFENGKSSSNYSTSYSYDLMGNILTLKRNGLLDDGSYATIDDLTYTYAGNQVIKIDDSAEESPCYDGAMHFIDNADHEEEYTYDANGNMTSDLNKRILRIDYNELNLPRQIDVNGSRVGSGLHKTIKYTYAADGTKLRAEYTGIPFTPIILLSMGASVRGETPSIGCSSVISDNSFIGGSSIVDGGTYIVADSFINVKPSTTYSRTSTIDYCSNLIYENTKLSTILFDGGYASVDADGNIAMHYYVKDHLGSNRLVVDGNGNIEETNHYYPFGALMGDSKNVKRNKYKYVGKELDRMYGIDMQDHGARWYDPIVGRWSTSDILSEKYLSISSYISCYNNPIKLIDINGKETYLYVTTLPFVFDISGWRRIFKSLLKLPTHTFIVVTNKKGEVRGYYAYGSEKNDITGMFSGRLLRRRYNQDEAIIEGKDKEHLKAKIKIDVPKNITSEEFDNKVIEVAESFGDNNEITYNILSTSKLNGNCNSSTSTILIKSGVSEENMKMIKDKIPGLSIGFSINKPKPWTKEEQDDAANNILNLFIK